MKNIIFLFLVALVFPTVTLSQNKKKSDNKPKAYLFSSGDTQSGKRPNKAYLVSGGDTRSALSRPRIFTREQPANTKKTTVSKAYDLERRTFDLINQRREKCGLAQLKWSDEVARVARMHSENMASFNFFSHSGIDGLMVNERADLLGIRRWQAIGENIAYNQGFENPVEFAVERWMQSPKHRDNLLNSRWRESGIGIAVTGDGTYYFTEVFIVRK